MSVALHVWVSIHHMIVFCCTSLKWWHLQMLFIFSKFCFSGLLGGWRVKGKKWPRMRKKFCLTPYLRNSTSYDCGFWYTCVKWCYLQQLFCFHFFQNSDFSGFSKFINECQKEILSCAPPSSHLCDFWYTVLYLLLIINLSTVNKE